MIMLKIVTRVMMIVMKLIVSLMIVKILMTSKYT